MHWASLKRLRDTRTTRQGTRFAMYTSVDTAVLFAQAKHFVAAIVRILTSPSKPSITQAYPFRSGNQNIVNNKNNQTQSIWMQSGAIPVHGALLADAETDVCVVGAGIAGLTTAYLLILEGKSVFVLDDGPVGGGQTERTTAHLSNAIDDRYFLIERLHGESGARLTAESHSTAIDQVESIVQAEEIDCDFERLDGYLFSSPSEASHLLDAELKAARRAGLSDVQLVPRCPLPQFETGECLRFPRQAQFHPRKYLAGLTKGILRRGGRIFSMTHVTKIESGTPAIVRTEKGPSVRAASVVVAANTPFNDFVTMHTKQAPYMTYVLAFGVPRGAVTKALYWDTEDPYHYARLQTLPEHSIGSQSFGETHTEELLIVGGEDHKTGQADDAEERYRRLEAWTRERFPIIGGPRCHWSGQVLETIDGLAFIGRNPLDSRNIYIATGDSGQGMTHGTIAGILLTDLILERENSWESLYDPGRKSLLAAKKYLEENVNVAMQYGAWLTAGEFESLHAIASGTGGVIRRGLSKIAVYRDEGGTMHKYSAVCPHLGCIVQWNHNENSWDCPCHGSRFDKHGHLLCGPANCDLATIDLVPIPLASPLSADS